MARNIITASDSSDTYLYRTTLLNTPMNLFGSLGKYPVFKFCKTDEYILSLTGNAKIPVNNPEDKLFSLSTYLSSGFYMNENDILKIGTEVKLQTDDSWSAETSISYKRRTAFSPILSLCRLCYKKRDWSTSILTRTNNLDAKLSKKYDVLTQEYELGHKINIEFSSFITINAGTSASATYKSSTETLTLNLTGTLGGKINF